MVLARRGMQGASGNVLVLGAVVEVENMLTVIPFYYPMENKASNTVLKCVSEVILWIRNSEYCSSITAGRFIQGFMSDNGGEFTSHPFIHGMHKLGVTLTTAPSYQPQSTGMVERCVGLMKTAVHRLLVSGNLADKLWPYAVHFATQLQQAKALGYPWDQPMFGEFVTTWRLKSKDGQAATEPRGTFLMLDLRKVYTGVWRSSTSASSQLRSLGACPPLAQSLVLRPPHLRGLTCKK
eukprot:1143725-Amphidinium_carterae.1